MARAELSLGRP